MNLKESKQSNCLVAMYLHEMPLIQSLAESLYSLAEQTKPVDVVILTHGLSAEELESVKLVADSPYYTVTKKNEKGEVVSEEIKASHKLNYSIIPSEVHLNFSKIFNTTFNLALKSEYEHMSIVEAEDSFSLKWFELADVYSYENPEISIFLPLMRNSINNTFTGLLNEAAWAEGMSEEAGKVDINLLLRFNCVNPLGAIYKIKPIKEYSELDKEKEGVYKPMKESMKLSHYYEFFLRMIYNDLKVMTIPRLGYELRIVRKTSFADSTCKLPQDITQYPADRGGVSQDEGRFWFDLAKKEYFFDEDRCKTFSPALQPS